MTHRARIGVLAILVLAAMSEDAAAGILGWLGRMSGPGPFISVDVSRCIPLKHHPKAQGVAGAQQESAREAGAAIIICPQAAEDRYARHWTLYVTGGVAGSYDNDLNPDGHNAHAVWILNLGVSADYTVYPWLALGVGTGANHFIGQDFKGFARPYVEPYFSVRPALIGKRTVNEASGRGEAIRRSFILTVGRRVLFADLDGASFGAPNDPWPGAHNEGRWNVSIGIDLLMLVHKKRVEGY